MSHAAASGPWWFASSGGGRFDLAGPEGTCYLAESEIVVSNLLAKLGLESRTQAAVFATRAAG